MFCSNCGRQIKDGSNFCEYCGKPLPRPSNANAQYTHQPYQDPYQQPYQQSYQQAQYKPQGSLVGFSPKINDAAFAKYQKASSSWSYIFSLILALCAVIGFPIYGSVSGELDMPYSLYYGMGIGGMFVAIAFFQSMSRKTDTTWDGVVIDKKIYQKQHWDKNSDTHTTYTVYEYKVKRDNGKIYRHSTNDDDTVYNYYNIGDRVRHHKGFGGYEKYDKSKDTFLFCTACGSINELSDDTCFRCKCPLLK